MRYLALLLLLFSSCASIRQWEFDQESLHRAKICFGKATETERWEAHCLNLR